MDPLAFLETGVDPASRFETVVLGSDSVPAPGALLPPWPVIGLGALDAGDAARVDVVAPTSAVHANIVQAIRKQPRAAAVLVQFLRATAGVDPALALPLESLAYAALQAGGDHSVWLASHRALARPPPYGDSVVVERDSDELAIVLNRPDTHNAVDREMRDALHAAFELVAIDSTITIATVHSRGRSFSVGGDLGEFGTTRDPGIAHEIRSRTLPARSLVQCADRVRFHLRGACIGAGIEMAAFGGHVIADPATWFHLPELSMGLIPGAGGCVSIPRRIGRQRTALLVLTGKRIGAATALKWGLIDAIARIPMTT